MTRLNLFLNLMDIIHNLLQNGVTCCNVEEARTSMDNVWDKFEEDEGVPISDRQRSFEDTFFNVMYLPEEIKQYCYTIEGFHTGNEIYLEALPIQCGDNVEQFQLIVGLFKILNELLAKGINGCNNHEARTQIDDLFNCFIEVDDIIKAELFRKLLDEEEDTTDSLSHFFPDLQSGLDRLTLFPA